MCKPTTTYRNHHFVAYSTDVICWSSRNRKRDAHQNVSGLRRLKARRVSILPFLFRLYFKENHVRYVFYFLISEDNWMILIMSLISVLCYSPGRLWIVIQWTINWNLRWIRACQYFWKSLIVIEFQFIYNKVISSELIVLLFALWSCTWYRLLGIYIGLYLVVWDQELKIATDKNA